MPFRLLLVSMIILYRCPIARRKSFQASWGGGLHDKVGVFKELTFDKITFLEYYAIFLRPAMIEAMSMLFLHSVPY